MKLSRQVNFEKAQVFCLKEKKSQSKEISKDIQFETFGDDFGFDGDLRQIYKACGGALTP